MVAKMAKYKNGNPVDAVGPQENAGSVRRIAGPPEYAKRAERIRDEDLARIVAYINEIRYGSVTVIIQDGYVVQIEKNEKIRFRQPEKDAQGTVIQSPT
jgi:hypothetical protein